VSGDQITRRLKRVEGQIRGLQRMVEDERDCEAILTQLIAARAALDRVGLLVVDRFVERCLATDDPLTAQQRVRRVLDLIVSRYSVPGADEDTTQRNLLAPVEEE
jgi:DNA-binding FrmR family transcriptional regulator